MDQPADTPRQEPLGEALVRVARKYATQRAHALDALAIGPTQLQLLELVNTEPGLCMAVVAERLAVDKAAVSRAVRGLIRNGFVERCRGHRDRRCWELGATRSGCVALQVAGPSQAELDARMFAGFSDDGLQRLRTCLLHLDANLDVTPLVYIRRLTRGSDHAISWLDEPV